MKRDHQFDAFRQLLYQVLLQCADCRGRGILAGEASYQIGRDTEVMELPCDTCDGVGRSPTPRTIQYKELRGEVIETQLALGIDPTDGYMTDAFERLGDNDSSAYEAAQVAFDLAVRREISQEDFGLEPLGLAMWSVPLPAKTGSLAALSETETQMLLHTVARILATENILLPPQPLKPWEWPFDDRMRPYDRQRIIPGRRRQDNLIPYSLQPHRKLGRYVGAIARVLEAEDRIEDSEQWLNELHWPLWKALRGFEILVPAGRRVNDEVPHGIRVDRFELVPVRETVYRCRACRYVMGDALLGVCYRCGQDAEEVSPESVQNYFRRVAKFAEPGTGYPTPSPFAQQHTQRS